MYLVVIVVLSVVLTFSSAPYRYITGLWPTLALVGVATLVPVLLAAIVNHYVIGRLDRCPQNPGRGQAIYHRGLLGLHASLGLLHIGLLLTTSWLVLVRKVPVVGDWPLIPGVLALGPFLVSVILAWCVLYPSDRSVRQIALEQYLFRGRPLRAVWSRAQYLMFNLRHQVLFILAPMLLILLGRDVVLYFEDRMIAATGQQYIGDLVLGVIAIGVAVVAPEILRHVWVTQRLPDGPLRDQLLVLCRRLKLRCRDILVWRSGGMLVNAAVMGVIAPLRYVLITDAMLEQLDDRKIEAVFGHEAGHVKRHHILFFLLFAGISGCIIMIFSVRMQGLARGQYEIVATVLGTLMVLKWGVLFGWISRRFERQADIYGVRTLQLSGLPCELPCAVHHPDLLPQLPPGGDRLCSTAAHVFSQGLHEVALLNGMRPEARSWRHSSISSRSLLVQKLARDPIATRRFERNVLLVKAGIMLVALILGTWTVFEMRLWTLLKPLLS